MGAKKAEPAGAGAEKTRPAPAQRQAPGAKVKSVELPEAIAVSNLANVLGTSPIEVIKQLMRQGVMANINQVISYEIAAGVASAFGYEPKETRRRGLAIAGKRPAAPQKGELRPPVVTILGHVDHGKTTLLDAIRQSNVVATEAGSITQHIGAYQVETDSRKITFLDTPGHEAFTAMRARGAQVTDIAIVVVAADDGVMPQTVEAIDHAKAADVPILVAINKIDKPNANIERVKKQLADMGVLIEEWGGDVVCVAVSAKKREGITDLLENLLVVAEVLELKADPHRPAQGAVIEARLDKSRGPLATVLVQNGTLRIGDIMVAGNAWGRIRAMFNDRGKHLKKAEPATPAEVLGLNSVPRAGDTFTIVPNERQAKELLQRQQEEQKQALGARRLATLDSLAAQISAGEVKELNLILKTDVQGSIEPIRDSLERLHTEQAKVRVIHSGSGSITESDVLLALASKGIIIGFNTPIEPGAKRLAEVEGVDIRSYQVIYNLVDDVNKALSGLLKPATVEVVEGRAQVLAVFPVKKLGKVAGARVVEGRVSRDSPARVLRSGKVVHDSRVASLKHYQEFVTEIGPGQECGIGIEGFADFEVGDIIETYRRQQASSP
ncbi:MAG TPA: translation initiation factor IF-2 [Dehalococcoidia bacterium]|nr:translation initiation factor IF-2 [Dehalococcoidia bacterium]